MSLLILNTLKSIWRLALLNAIIMCAGGCSFVEFEPSPYAPRSVNAVFSTQENLTFLFWQIDESAEIDQVSFEYFDPNVNIWKPIKLSQAIYPASPSTCGSSICFQYQLPNKVVWAESAASFEGEGRAGNLAERGIRSVHVDGVTFGALDLRQRTAEITFGVAPIAIKQNVQFDPRRYDFFQTISLILKRSYEWRLTPSSAMNRDEHIVENCQIGSDDWRFISETVLPAGWTMSAHCFELRPVTRIITAPTVLEPLPPSAVLKPMNLTYTPSRHIPLTFFVSLNDLLVRNTRRCAQLQGEIVDTLRGLFESKTPASQRVDLGDWFPLTPVTAESYTDCAQPFDRVYPSTQILDDIKREILDRGSDDQVVFAVYTNNNDDPLPDQVKRGFETLLRELFALPNTRIFMIMITGDVLSTSMVSLPTQAVIEYELPWRAREITPFDEQMQSIAETIFPFHTVDFTAGVTPISLNEPRTASPLEFKICALTPNLPLNVTVEGEGTFSGERFGVIKSYPWGMGAPPKLFMNLLEQKRVTQYELIEEKVVLRYEICEFFCNFPFVNQAGDEFPKWSEEVTCQREEE
jgi:hypothetical protein